MDNSIRNCTGVILAGGENSRMPVLKGLIKVRGQRIIERNLFKLNGLFNETFIITNTPESYIDLKAPMFGDLYDKRGPMTGILTSLYNSPADWVFISACDMPFINTNLIRYMASKRKGFGAVVPLFRGKAEPLFAFYSKTLINTIERSLIRGRKGLKDFLNDKRVQYIKIEELINIDPEGSSFINLNAPEDIELFLEPADHLRFKKTVERRQ